jgi:hypothetical protein
MAALSAVEGEGKVDGVEGPERKKAVGRSKGLEDAEERSAERRDAKGRINRLGLLLILGGFLLTLAVLYFEAVLETPPEGKLARTVLEFLADLGLAFASLGIIGVIINLPDWQEYFRSRLADTIMRREYLQQLGSDELRALQVETLKAFFKTDEIDRSGSFLSHFEKEIRQHIASPFREQCNCVLKVSEVPESVYFQVDDTLSYVCRSMDGRIQDSIQWVAEEGELFEEGAVEVILELPSNPGKSVVGFTEAPEVGNDNRRYTFPKGKFVTRGTAKEYRLALDPVLTCDGLIVSIHTSYKTRQDRFLSWAASTVTKGFAFTISYPEGFKPVVEYFGISRENVLEQRSQSFLHVRCDGWMLPGYGIVVDLAKL